MRNSQAVLETVEFVGGARSLSAQGRRWEMETSGDLSGVAELVQLKVSEALGLGPFGLGTEVWSRVQLQCGFRARQVGTGAGLRLNRSHSVRKERKSNLFPVAYHNFFSKQVGLAELAVCC